jgi:hypothetical protein
VNRNDHKQRWIQRQQQEEEQPRVVYPLEEPTYFGHYIAIVYVYTKNTVIELYKKAPSVKKSLVSKALSKLLDIPPEDEQICIPRSISHLSSVHHTMKAMIVEFELPLYQKYMAEELQGKMEIDYAEELRKKRQRLANIDREPVQETVRQYAPPTIDDYLSEREPTEEEKKEQRIQELAARDGVDPAKYRNLLPFQNKKSS